MIENGTVCLEYVDYMLYAPKNGEERAAHMGIFTGCMGALQAEYLGESINTRDIENALIELYGSRDIGFSTWQEFARQFRSCWNREFPVLVENLGHAQELTLIDQKATTTTDLETNGNINSTGVVQRRYSNTPNQWNPNSTSDNGLTDITREEGENGSSNYTQMHSSIVKDDSGNVFERWLELSSINRNIVYEFLDKFDWLFLSTYILS